MRHTRFIPVDTGNTQTHRVGYAPYAVHPRGYGEHIAFALDMLRVGGSSPWIRGTHQDRVVTR